MAEVVYIYLYIQLSKKKKKNTIRKWVKSETEAARVWEP